MISFSATVKLESIDKMHLYLKSGLQTSIAGLADDVLKSNRQNHLLEKDPDGVLWPPSRAGLARKAVGGSGTLFDTGSMFDASTISIKSLGFVIRNTTPYAAEHQYGIGQVQRQFLGIPNALLDGFIKSLSENMS